MRKLKLILVLFVVGMKVQAQQAILIKEGDVMPDFAVTDTNGIKTSMLKLAAGAKYTLVDFWASSCGPCRAAFPELKKVYDAFENKGFNVVGLDSQKDKPENWKAAIVHDNVNWTQVKDVEGQGFGLFDIAGIPSCILIDDKGKVLAASLFTKTKFVRQFGPEIRSAEGLTKALQKLLEKK